MNVSSTSPGVPALADAEKNPTREPQMNEDMWSPPQLAEYLGLCANTIYTLLAQGAIPGQLRLGRRWRISKIAFLRSIHGKAEATGGEP